MMKTCRLLLIFVLALAILAGCAGEAPVETTAVPVCIHEVVPETFDAEHYTGVCTLCGETVTAPITAELAETWVIGIWAEAMEFRADRTVTYQGFDDTMEGTWVCDGLITTEYGNAMFSYTVVLEDLTIHAGIYGDSPTIITMADEGLAFQFVGEKSP